MKELKHILDSGIEIYTNPDNSVRLEVKLDGDTVWLTQAQMVELFAVDRTTLLRHIRNIYRCGELEESATCAKNAQVRIEGKREVSRVIPYLI